MGTPVEIEYAFNLDEDSGKPALYILQLKPLIHIQDRIDVDLNSVGESDAFIRSDKTMGNGRESGLYDILWVDPATFDRSRTVEMAAEIEAIDARMKREGKRCILVGPGRWGTRDRWLGIPVTFAQISSAKVIVEVDLPGFVVDSSLGSHFFHNLTSMNIGYMKIIQDGGGSIDWEWLRSMPAKMTTEHCRWTSLETPVEVLMDGRSSKAVILKQAPPIIENSFDQPVGIIDG